MAALSPALADLARAMGVATEFWDWQGKHVNVAPETVRAVLGALGVDASDDEAAARALHRQDVSRWRQVLPPCVVTRRSAPGRVPVHLPHGAELTAHVVCEDGTSAPVAQVEHNVEPRQFADLLVGEAMLELPADLPLGYHELQVCAGGEEAACPVICSPDTIPLPESLARPGSQQWGVMAQLYQARSELSWGIGDFADMGDIGAWSARMGADFMLVNPLHATSPQAPIEASPYQPVSRRFISPIYIRVEDIPEVAYLSSAERRLVEWQGDDARELNAEDTIDRDTVWSLKLAALRMVFERPRAPRRDMAFRSFCELEGKGLLDFATWCALCDEHGSAWQDWPEELQDPASQAVTQAREAHAEDIEFWQWVQWIAAEQLEAVQRDLAKSGMRLGVITDLAVGVGSSSAETWTAKEVFAHEVSIGAPPDAYNQLGQDWGMPPMRPDRLAELGYAPFRDLLRTVLREAGGVRIDHIIGLFRLWWIPRGLGPGEGTYVRFDHEAMVSVLALEATRAGAVVIGEDLGTVEDWVRGYLEGRGVLGTSILWFEWAAGSPKPPEDYREMCLSTVTVHDLPPTAGYLEGIHLTVRDALGLLSRPIAEEQAEDEANRDRVLSMLRQYDLLGQESTVEEQVVALHRFLARTPSKLVGVALADMAGDRRPINQPGTAQEYPNWKLPLSGPDSKQMRVERLLARTEAGDLAEAVRRD